MLCTFCTAKPTTDLEKKSSNLVEQQQNNPLHKRPLWDLPLIHDAVGCLQANKKKPGSLRQGLIKVNCLLNNKTQHRNT